MLRTFPLVAVIGLAFGSFLQAQPYPHIAPTEPKTPAEELKTFKLPAGFEAQLVASEPDIRKPIQMCFDARGRLWVTTSEEYPFPARGRPGKDRLYVLEDFGADGKAKKVSIFADDLNIPIGVLPLPDCKSVIVSSIDPGDKKDAKLTCWIWKLTDTDGDGKYDKKEKLYGPFGCDDTHGMNNSYTLMPDGWVYACHGFRNDSRPKGKDGHEIVMNSGNTFRFRPDGSRIEIWTRGQVNPFGIAVDPYFNLYTADCHSKPITQLIRGATYQSFSKPHDGLGFAPHVTIHGHDSTALCGLVYYAADHFPKVYLDCMFLGNVTSNCINMDKIEFVGSSPKGIDKGMFLSSSDLWCRPVDIKLGPDGALYFTDFYNKIIGHYEVKLDHPARDKLRGRVWRIIYRGADGKGEAPKMMPDLTTVHIREVAKLLGDSNLTVRLMATHQLVARMKEFEAFFKNELTENKGYKFGFQLPYEGMAHWSWYSYFAPSTDNPAISLAAHLMSRKKAEPSIVQIHEIRIVESVRERLKNGEATLGAAVSLLDHPNPIIRRLVVELLIAYADQLNAKPIVAMLSSIDPKDTHLLYATRLALRQSLSHADDWDTAAGKTSWSTAELRALADVAPAVPTAAAAAFLVKHLKELDGDTGRLSVYVEHASRYAADAKVLLDIIKNRSPDDLKLSIVLLNAYQHGQQKRGGAGTDPEATALAEKLCDRAIVSADAVSIQAGIDLAMTLKLRSAFEPLTRLLQDKLSKEAQRASALPALAALDAPKAIPLLVKFLNDANEGIAIREKAAQALAGTNRSEAYEELVKSFGSAPARLQTAMAVSMATNNKGAELLLKAIENGKASARLLQDRFVQTRLNERKLPKTAERIAALTKGLPSADARMAKLLSSRRGAFATAKPDAALGKQVFTKNCAICHQIGNEGTKIGPQLDGIGGRGLDRLLEDVLDPNRNVDAAFRTTIITLTDGKNINGLQLREEGALLVMADDKGKEVRVPKKDIDEKRTSLLSPMPANVAEIIPEKDFYDLLAYLLTQRAKEK